MRTFTGILHEATPYILYVQDRKIQLFVLRLDKTLEALKFSHKGLET